jgi:DNA-binding NarL/FixJ family response regulator
MFSVLQVFYFWRNMMPISKTSLNVLLVEDHLHEANLVREWLAEDADGAFNVTHVCVVYSAVRLLCEKPFHVVLLDLSLPDSYGLETVLAIREPAPEIPIVVLSGIKHPRTVDQVRDHGVIDFLYKDEVDSATLAWTLRQAVEREKIVKTQLTSLPRNDSGNVK